MSAKTIDNNQNCVDFSPSFPSGSTKEVQEPIAIIGIGCRFPGNVHDPNSFWNLLCNGTDAISEVPRDRWSLERFYDPDVGKPGKTTSRWGGFVNQQIELFDASFFGMSPREAAHLDPMQRWLMEVTWEAFEDAGQLVANLAGSDTGVFIGCFTEDIKMFHATEVDRTLIGPHTATGIAMTLVANRLSYLFDFRGPSIALDTACSSSLVAVHLACMSIWNKESSLAVAGGVNAMFRPEYTIAESKAGMLSPDGRCKTFDSRANGYVRGEGAGVVILKPLRQARADDDPIYAIIRGSGANQDGRTNGITVPNGEAQQQLMRTVCQRAGISPQQLHYVEAHGTGTPVGDPIEANALATVLAEGRTSEDKCLIGSVKTNIGHLEAAAGIAGLIKVALSLKHGAIPPHLHLCEPNPNILFDDLCVRVPQTLEPWPATDGPRLASINSFGFGGTNAHVVLEGPPQAAEHASLSSKKLDRTELLLLSAHTPKALRDTAASYQAMVQSVEHTTSPAFLYNLCYSASLHREFHDYRLALPVTSAASLLTQLQVASTSEQTPGMIAGQRREKPPQLVFVFGGMGPQWWAMGRQLLEQEPIFRNIVMQCDAELSKYADWSLFKEMCADETHSRMRETQIAQPANFALQVGLAELWQSWGVTPDAIVGHSAGEVAAAYVAGVLSFEDAICTIYHRSRLQHMTTGQGKLVAVGLPLKEIQELLIDYPDHISIAAVNSPSAVTLVGDADTLEVFVKPLQDQQIFVRFLHVDVPYHSHYMNPLQDELLTVLQDLKPQPAQIPLFSTVTGTQTDGTDWNASYWWRNVRDSVLFASASSALVEQDYDTFIEIAPHPVLASSIHECLTLQGRQGQVWPSLRRQIPDRDTLLETLGQLYITGYPVNWRGLYPHKGQFIPPPTYPWQHQRYWIEADETQHARLGGALHPFLTDRLSTSVPTWETTVDIDHLPYIADHIVQGMVIYPGAAYIEMILAAAKELFGDEATSIKLSHITFHKALAIPKNARPKLQLAFDEHTATFTIYSETGIFPNRWIRHASAQIQLVTPTRRTDAVLFADCVGQYQYYASPEHCYRYLKNRGLLYGPQFQGIREFWYTTNHAVAQIHLSDAVQMQLTEYTIHPVLLDVCFQIMIATTIPLDGIDDTDQRAYLPTSITDIHMSLPIPEQVWVKTTIVEFNDHVIRGSATVYDADGHTVCEIREVVAQSLDRLQTKDTLALQDLFYTVMWQTEDESPIEQSPVSQEQGLWIILADTQGIGSALAKQLEVYGDSCWLVFPEMATFTRNGSQCYVVDPSQPEDVHALVKKAVHQPQAFRGIVHLWGIDAPHAARLTLDDLEQAQIRGPITLLHVTQALTQYGQQQPYPRLWSVTKGAQTVDPTSVPYTVTETTSWGLMRALGYQEHREFFGGIIDLDPDAVGDEENVRMLFKQLINHDQDHQVVYRNGQRHVPRLVRSATSSSQMPQPQFRADSSYLITGGLGGLGGQIAHWMVHHGARRLILMGRTALPPRSAWSTIPPGTPQMERITTIRQLEAMGASIHVAAVDVADEAQLTTFLEQYDQEGWPPIRGVIHAAGITKSHLMVQMTQEDYQDIVRAKIRGAWLLHSYFRVKSLDFFVLFSSIAAFGFTIGQADYAAANAFLDGLALYRRTQGLPATSINWGAWNESGMAVHLAEYFRQRGIILFSPAQGLDALAHLLQSNVPQATVFAVDWAVAGQKNFPNGAVPSMITALVQEQKATSSTTTSTTNVDINIRQAILELSDREKQYAQVADHLQACITHILRLPDQHFDLQQPLNTLGLDSMMAVELRNAIEGDFCINISIMELLQGAGIDHLTNTILAKLPTQEELVVDDLLNEIQDLPEEELQLLLQEALANDS